MSATKWLNEEYCQNKCTTYTNIIRERVWEDLLKKLIMYKNKKVSKICANEQFSVFM